MNASWTCGAYDSVVSDLDGTLWLGGAPLPGAVDLLDGFRRRGAPVCVATNASVPTRAELFGRLADVGLMREGDGLVTAAEALAAQAVAARCAGGGGHRRGRPGRCARPSRGTNGARR